jgi:hypothetical protein
MSKSRSRSKSRSQEVYSEWRLSPPPLSLSEARENAASIARREFAAEIREEQARAALDAAERSRLSNISSIDRGDVNVFFMGSKTPSPNRAAALIGQVAQAAAVADAASRSVERSVEPSSSSSRSRPPPLRLVPLPMAAVPQVEGADEDYGDDDMGLQAAVVNAGIPAAQYAAALAAIQQPQAAPAAPRRPAARAAPAAGPAVDKSFVLNISKKDWADLKAMNPAPDLDMFKKAGLIITNGKIRATDTSRVRVWSDDYKQVLSPAQQTLDDRQLGVKTGRPKKIRADASYAEYAARMKVARRKPLSEAEWRESTGYSTDDDQAIVPRGPGGAARGRGRFNLISFRL